MNYHLLGLQELDIIHAVPSVPHFLSENSIAWGTPGERPHTLVDAQR